MTLNITHIQQPHRWSTKETWNQDWEHCSEVANYPESRTANKYNWIPTELWLSMWVEMLTGIKIKNINHWGIIAGIIDELQIVDIINQELVIDEQEIVNSGEIVKAIILNGLGFVSQPWYLFPKFFEDKA